MVGGAIVNSSEIVCQLSGDGFRFNDWYSFMDLDNFDSEHLVRNLSLPGPEGQPFTWNNDEFAAKCSQGEIYVTALRQAESLFNLSQLMFALYHGSLHACTFLDLQKNRPPQDIRQRGFVKLDNCNVKSGTSFRQALHGLCWSIVESGGLPVIFSMIQNPVLPIIQQKCLDALTNILCVDHIEWLVLCRQSWFLEKLVKMVEGGDLQCDMVPAISVVDRLIVVVLSDNMEAVYKQLQDLDFVTICVSQLQEKQKSHGATRLHYIKFQTIAMQALALLCQDIRSTTWPERVQEKVFSHAYHCALHWDTEQPPSDPKWDRSESFYKNMSFSSSALLFSLVILIHAVLKWPGMKERLSEKGLMFKYQLSKMMTLAMHTTSCHHKDSNAPIIKNAVEWLLRVLFTNSESETTSDAEQLDSEQLCCAILNPLSELSEKVFRLCSYKACSKRETQVGQWQVCKQCKVTCYCSEACRRKDERGEHNPNQCSFLSMEE